MVSLETVEVALDCLSVSALQSMVDASAQRLVSLANQWEKHRAPLIQQHRELREVSEDRVVS